MRKFSTLAIALALMIAAVVPAFSESFDGVIKAQVENGNALNSKIKKLGIIPYDIDTIMLSGTYAKGGFTVTLPKQLDAKYLIPLKMLNDSLISISDTNANHTYFQDIDGFGINGSFVARFKQQDTDIFLDKDNDLHVDMTLPFFQYWYVDRDVRYEGTRNYHSIKSSYNLNLKKGWNMVSMSYEKASTFIFETVQSIDNRKWLFSTNPNSNSDYSSALQTHFAKGTLGASGKTRPIKMFFQEVSGNDNFYSISGKSKTNAAEDDFYGYLRILSENIVGSCKKGENELKGIYNLNEIESETSGYFAGTFTACEKNGKLTKASFKGDWIKRSTGNKTPCNFEL